MERGCGAIVLAAALVLAGTPAAQAAEPTCEEATDTDALAAGSHYLRIDDEAGEAEAWEETNGVAELQTTACQTADGETVDADTHVATIPPVDVPTPGELIQFVIETCNDLYGGPNDYCI